MPSSALRVYCSTVHCVASPGSWHLLSICVSLVLQRHPRAWGCCWTMIQNCLINLRTGCVGDSEPHIPPLFEMVLVSPSSVGLSGLILHPRVMLSLLILIWSAVGSLWWTSNTYPCSFSILLVIMSSLVILRQIYILDILAVSLLFSSWTIFPASFSKYYFIKYKTCAKKLLTLSYIKTNAYSIHPQSCASNTTLYTDLKFLYFLFFFWCVCVCHNAHVQVEGQLAVVSLLLPCEFQVLNSGHQVRQQTPSSTKPSRQPQLFNFKPSSLWLSK